MKAIVRVTTVLMVLATVLAAELAVAEKVPKVFGAYLERDTMIKGQVVMVMPPREINKYLAKVKEAADADPEWFEAYSKAAKPGVPVPYHKKLGLTKEEYDAYLKLWAKREIKPVPDSDVVIRLEQLEKGAWMIRVSGEGYPITNLRYLAEKDVMKSPNGTMVRIEDVDADEMSRLGKWTGHEWRYSEKDSLGATKENFAIGKTGDGKYGLMLYRLQSLSLSGRVLADTNRVIRFPLSKK